jgi:Hypervirulence associated proteins TUDOR domain
MIPSLRLGQDHSSLRMVESKSTTLPLGDAPTTGCGRRRSELFGSIMVKTFKVGEHVSWNSEAGRVRGKIIKVHWREVNYKGYIHHAGSDDPLYEIKSDTTDHVAFHKAAALRRLG